MNEFSLPDFAQDAIEAFIGDLRPSDLRAASENLSDSYRRKQPGRHLGPQASIAAYLAARLPATFAAVTAVLREVALRAPNFAPATLLDLGAGPGTATLAASQIFPSLRQAQLREREAGMIEAGRQIFAEGPAVLREALWQQGDLLGPPGTDNPLPQAELILASYVLNEMSGPPRQRLLDALLASRAVVVLIEPGTPTGYGHILELRERALAAGRHIWAPCPHHNACPLAGDDWCHFAQRLGRSSLQRYLKQGSQSFEDEKFSYLVISPEPVSSPAAARILRHPRPGKGHIELSLCMPEGAIQRTIGKSNPAYKAARKADWGDAWQAT